MLFTMSDQQIKVEGLVLSLEKIIASSRWADWQMRGAAELAALAGFAREGVASSGGIVKQPGISLIEVTAG